MPIWGIRAERRAAVWPTGDLQPFNDEQMGSTPYGDADPACLVGSATPQKMKSRGDRGRVGADGCA
jgi:hypothetical protein